MDKLRDWVQRRNGEPVIVPRRQERFLGGQPPGIVESDSVAENFADQTRLTQFPSKPEKRSSLTDKIANEERKKSAGVLQTWAGKMTTQDTNVSGDAPDANSAPWPEAQRFLATADDVYKTETDPLKRFVKKKMFKKEAEEHPGLDDTTIDQIVDDHFRQITNEG